jgi:hypothetical protein
MGVFDALVLAVGRLHGGGVGQLAGRGDTEKTQRPEREDGRKPEAGHAGTVVADVVGCPMQNGN